MTQTEEKTAKKFIELPPKNKDKDRILEKICYGNSRIGKLLDYFIYGANQDAGYHGLEGCNVVTLTDRKHDAIMEKLPFNVSRKTLICHLDLLDKWGYVLSEPYSRDFAVHKDKILEAISNPPEKPKRPYYNRHPQKGCNSTTLQPSENEESADSEKCVDLHNNVVEGNNNVVTLHKKVDILLQLQPHLETLVELAEAYKNDPYSNNSNKQVITGDIEAIASHPLFQSLFDLVSSQAKQLAEMKSQLDQLSSKQEPSGDTNVPNLTAPTTSTQPAPLTNSDIRDNPSIEHADPSSSAHGVEDKQDVEQKSIQDGQLDHIAKVTTKDKEKNNMESLAIGDEIHTSLFPDMDNPLPSEEKPKRKPLQPPDASMPWNEEKAMLWANYFRKYAYPEKKHKNSKHYRAYEAAELIIQREIDEKQFVYIYKYMTGVDKKFCSEYWSDKEVDIWTVNEHFEGQVKEIKRRKAASEPISFTEKKEKLKVKDLATVPFRQQERYKQMLAEARN